MGNNQLQLDRYRLRGPLQSQTGIVGRCSVTIRERLRTVTVNDGLKVRPGYAVVETGSTGPSVEAGSRGPSVETGSRGAHTL